MKNIKNWNWYLGFTLLILATLAGGANENFEHVYEGLAFGAVCGLLTMFPAAYFTRD